jgi:hypothetical protein
MRQFRPLPRANRREDVLETLIAKEKTMTTDINAAFASYENTKPEPWHAPLQQIRCNTTEAEALRERLVLLGMLGMTKQAAMESAIPHLMDTENGGLRTFRESDFVSGQS